MKSLRERQAWMLAAIRDGLPNPAEAAQHFAATPALSATTRLRIYQHAYRARMLHSFHETYPGLLHALGVELLDAFALDYLLCNPPRHYSLNRLADGFAEYLRATRPGENEVWASFIVDLAAFEGALLVTSEAEGLELAFPSGARTPRRWDGNAVLAMRPHRPPCVQLLRCQFPVSDYVKAVRSGEAPDFPEPRACALALTRVDYRFAVRELAPVQWELLARLRDDTSVSDALTEVSALGLKPTPTGELVGVWIANFVAQGLLSLPQ